MVSITYDKYDISFDEFACWNCGKPPIAHCVTSGRNHGKEGGEDRLALLQLVEFDESIEEGNSNQNTA